MNTRLLAAFGSLSLVAVSSAASLLTVHSMTAGKYSNLTIRYNSTNLSVAVGPQRVSLDGGSRFDAYCVDLDNANSLGASYLVNVLSTASIPVVPPRGARIGYLYNTYSAGVNDNFKGAALQLAIWDVLVDGGDGLGVGNFKYVSSPNATILSHAATYLAGSLGQSASAAYFSALSHTNHRNQNLVGPGSANPVPEPVTMALAVAGLGLAARRRRA